MTLVKWEPFRDLLALQPRFQSLWSGDDAHGAWFPAVDVFENGDRLVIRADVAGVDKGDLDVRVEDNTLVLRGERKREREFDEENAYRMERSYGTFVRSFRLPKTVDASRIEASYKDGVLEISLPKAAEARPRKIKIAA